MFNFKILLQIDFPVMERDDSASLVASASVGM